MDRPANGSGPASVDVFGLSEGNLSLPPVGDFGLRKADLCVYPVVWNL